ncbi:MAG: GNAT family N-acetyltransferase [Henriciella sp.]
MLRAVFWGIAVWVLAAISGVANAQSPYPFVDKGFEVPEELVTEDFRVRMLSMHDVIKDYDAVMASAEQLKENFPRWGGWPDGLTVEADLLDLAWHQKEFVRRTSFTYTVVSLDDSTVLGCIYIYPTRKTGYDADITLWARESVIGSPADIALDEAVRAWVEAEWQFENPAYPGRDMSWEEWDELPTSKR